MAMCCSFIAISGILSELTIKEVSVEALAHKKIHAEEPTLITLRLTNHKNKIPSYSLNLSLPKNRGYIIENSVQYFHIPSLGSVDKSVLLTACKRGPIHIHSCELSTSFPFGFFIKSRTIELNINSLVFPAIRKVMLPSPAENNFDSIGTIVGQGEELYALRDFRAGDGLSAVHWKSTAKTGDLRVKEFSRGGNQRYTIFLNTIDPQTNKSIDSETLEQRVIESASLCYHLIRRGDEVSLKTHDHIISYGSSESKLEEILSFLALVGLEK
ncbi:MAG: hypothetical protein A3K09_02830, partial [Nitrospinae bacterium RIFCSPLOWO2_12_FULL_47_7]